MPLRRTGRPGLIGVAASTTVVGDAAPRAARTPGVVAQQTLAVTSTPAPVSDAYDDMLAAAQRLVAPKGSDVLSPAGVAASTQNLPSDSPTRHSRRRMHIDEEIE